MGDVFDSRVILHIDPEAMPAEDDPRLAAEIQHIITTIRSARALGAIAGKLFKKSDPEQQIGYWRNLGVKASDVGR